MAAAPTEDVIRDALRSVDDPEVGMNIVDLGLVYAIEATPERIAVRMTMTTPACPLGETIMAEARRAIQQVAPAIDRIDIDLVWEPPWTPELMSENARGFFGWRAP